MRKAIFFTAFLVVITSFERELAAAVVVRAAGFAPEAAAVGEMSYNGDSPRPQRSVDHERDPWIGRCHGAAGRQPP